MLAVCQMVKAEPNVLRQRAISVEMLLGHHMEYSAYEFIIFFAGRLLIL
jgi:NADH:ubiquinone oxidoreductase subunit H